MFTLSPIDEDLITTEAIPAFSKNGITVKVLRLDKIHPIISGNKWFKLRFHLDEALRRKQKSVVTYGGAYSNHIIATAAAAAKYGLKSFGLIRGEKPKTYSHTLQAASAMGMELIFLSREDYKNKYLPAPFNNTEHYIIPEGGYSPKGAAGAATIPYNKNQFDVITCAVGTGTMMAGLINSKHPESRVIGISALKNNTGLETEVQHLLNNKNNPITIHHNYHFGGYAKYNSQLIGFMNELYHKTSIPTDFVYTAKMFFGIKDLIDKGAFTNGSNILLIHSGGLQGNFSLPKPSIHF